MLKLPLAPFVGEQRNGAVGGDGLMGLAAAVLEVQVEVLVVVEEGR